MKYCSTLTTIKLVNIIIYVILKIPYRGFIFLSNFEYTIMRLLSANTAIVL